MAEFVPRQILGKWRLGYALDLHTLSSTYIGDDEYGHAQFDAKRSAIGDLLYRLKYHGDQGVLDEIVNAARRLVRDKGLTFDIIVPVPPSTQRKIQPVMLIAEALGHALNKPVKNCVMHRREASPLKNVRGYDERIQLLDGLHSVEADAVRDTRVLLFDDLYRSGATMNALTQLIYDCGAKEVVVLAITRTRSNQ
ncbi:MAG TPA: hypothetical protein VEI03_13575 [Stellaceae bacterium]|nr:hypothetical protein [Stellaceae bacterium]